MMSEIDPETGEPKTYPLDLEAIEERLEKITPGKWELDDHECCVCVEDYGLIANIEQGGYAGDPYSEANARMIANAPTDIAALVEEVKRLRREVGKAKHIGKREMLALLYRRSHIRTSIYQDMLDELETVLSKWD